MEIRKAQVSDVKKIFALINEYAEQDRMLFRSMADIYENLRSFSLAEDNGNVVGCCALHIIWSDLAEIKSLAVSPDYKGKGTGRKMVEFALEEAAELGLARVFALTMEPDFFQRIGFTRIDMDELPMKVWSDCAKCPKQQNCDEIAVIKTIEK